MEIVFRIIGLLILLGIGFIFFTTCLLVLVFAIIAFNILGLWTCLIGGFVFSAAIVVYVLWPREKKE